MEGKADNITVYDGNVSVFVVLGQRHRRLLLRGHDPDRPAAVGALHLGRGSQLRGLVAQRVRKGEGGLCGVSTVGLVPPLHHRRFAGGRMILAPEDHGLEEHGVLLLVPHCDVHAITHAD